MNKAIKMLERALKTIEDKCKVQYAINSISYEYEYDGMLGSFPTLNIHIQMRDKPKVRKLKKNTRKL